MGGTAGMASAAQESLPGQALYPVKRGLEKAAVTLSGRRWTADGSCCPRPAAASTRCRG